MLISYTFPCCLSLTATGSLFGRGIAWTGGGVGARGVGWGLEGEGVGVGAWIGLGPVISG